jgi:hypothetical protein
MRPAIQLSASSDATLSNIDTSPLSWKIKPFYAMTDGVVNNGEGMGRG